MDIEEYINDYDKRRMEKGMIKYHLTNLWYFIERTYRDISFFIRLSVPSFFVRGKRGWAKMDTWSFDKYLSTVIADGLIHMKNNSNGYPSLLTEEEWGNILQEMADGFNEYVAYESREYPGDKEEKFAEFYKAQEEAFRKLNRSLDLFKEHFQSLWD